jgi:soluble lytic murein transglycosylase
LVCATAQTAVAPVSEDVLVRLKAGVDALDKGQLETAAHHLSAVQPRLPLLADYVAFWLGQARAQQKSFDAVPGLLEPVWKTAVPSPLAGRAAVLAARSQVERGAWQAALKTLSRLPAEQLPQPQASLLAAQAEEGAGNSLGAAAYYQTVYFLYPLSDEAGDARTALLRLERDLGERYPQPTPQLRLDRAGKLFDSRQAARAKDEYEDMASRLSGLPRDQARVRMGAADYQVRKTEAAIAHLRDLQVSSPEAEAERLYWLVQSYRRLDRDDEMLEAVDQLARKAPNSLWRQKALIQAANNFIVRNESARFVPLFQACADFQPQTDETATCHWKALWPTYLARPAAAVELMRAHLQKFPNSDKAGASLYYLGRVAEQAGDFAAAKRYWTELRTRYPNYYYTTLLGPRLGRPEVARAGASPATDTFLQSINWPVRQRRADVTPDDQTNQRLERARLLSRAGLDTWAESELRYGVRNGGKVFPLVIEMAESANRRGAPDVALRYVKGSVPNYLWLHHDGAPMRFWKLAFPFPYRARIESYCRQHSLDPFLVAALIRQESEFNHQVVSYANAIGLMQILPGTGRELGRKVGIRGVTAASLKKPDINLRLGTYYLRTQLDARNGSVEDTLAGYNAGPSRVPVWHGWADFREPSEFVETVPFTQTRDYIQIILRNAEMYRWIYKNEPAPALEPEPTPPPAPAPAAAKSKPKSKAKPPAKPATKGKASVKRKK